MEDNFKKVWESIPENERWEILFLVDEGRSIQAMRKLALEYNKSTGKKLTSTFLPVDICKKELRNLIS
jgi:hypothetical protein